MKTNRTPTLIACCLWMQAATLFAAVRYVDVNSANPTPPFTNWSIDTNAVGPGPYFYRVGVLP